MTVKVRKLKRATVLDLEGTLNQGQPVQSFLDAIHVQLTDGAPNLAINMGTVPMIDSSGVGALLRALTKANEAGARLIFFAAKPAVMNSLKRVRLDVVLSLAEDEASALASFD